MTLTSTPRWMAAAGVDGVWRQRFLSGVHTPGHGRDFNDKVRKPPSWPRSWANSNLS
jgi:hypothetical protein